jgi:hypothetical protein
MFDTSGFVPRWSCGDWSQPLGWLHIGSDLLIFLAYFAIPIALAVVMFRRRDLPFGALLALFVAFILACGSTHLIEAIIFYKPIYRVAGVAKAITAIVSVATAVILIRALPSLLALPGLQRVINDLRAALAREEHTRQELAAVRDTVERRSSEMTLRLRRIAASLSSARAVACRWQAQSGAVDWEVGFAESCRQAGLGHLNQFTGFRDLLIPADAERLQGEINESIRTGAPVDFQGTMSTIPERPLRLSASFEPEVEGQPRFMTGMFRIL